MNKSMLDTSAGNTGESSKNLPSVEEQVLRIEDMTCLKFKLQSIYQLKEVIGSKAKQLNKEREAIAANA